MIALALTLSGLLGVLAFFLRFGGASLVRTPRADALHDAADGVPGAARVARLLDGRAAIQPSLGVVHVALLVAAAIPSAWALAAAISGPGLAGALLVLGAALVLFGDTVPRSLGRNRPRGPAYRFSRFLSGSVRIGRKATDLIPEEDVGPASLDPNDSEELELISQVLEFTDGIVREVMVPRTDMITVAASDDTDRALDVVLECGRSRIPATGDDLDDIVGVLYARDLLTLFDTGGEARPVSKIMHTAFFVPETKKVSELFRELQSQKVHLAVVIDEFGGTAGLVTMEDLLEEIVGEIVDEYDEEEPLIQPVAEGEYIVDGRLPVDELAELFGTELPDEDWDTVGGLVLGLAGRVPEEGEVFHLDAITFTAERVQGRRVSRIRVGPA
ncbi:MAG: hemolysin family protein [Acidimicrobiia bacterium]